MTSPSCAYILGAGFSKAAGVPLATELLPLMLESEPLQRHDDLAAWADGLGRRAGRLTGVNPRPCSLGIEQVFHYAQFDLEVFRLREQLRSANAPVAIDIASHTDETLLSWIESMEEALVDTLWRRDSDADLSAIGSWARYLKAGDTVITFNYDTVAERAIRLTGNTWNHGFPDEGAADIEVFKLHGSLDWILMDFTERGASTDLLFDPPRPDGGESQRGSDRLALRRLRSREQITTWLGGRDIQAPKGGAELRQVGIAGLGAYKPLHLIPGLAGTWARAMARLNEVDHAVVIGFSMSEFDTMAQMQFAEVAAAREFRKKPLRTTVINPGLDDHSELRYRRTFGCPIAVVRVPVQKVQWATIAGD